MVEIEYVTSTFAPNHFVTVLCADSVNGSHVRGEYRGDRWHFQLNLAEAVRSTHVDFQLDGEQTQRWPDVITNTGRYAFTDKQIRFVDHKDRYVHGIDALLTEDTDLQRRFVRSNTDDSVFYDVIIIGSGMGGGILANALSDRGCRVLVLEAGCIQQTQHVANVPTANDTRTCVTYVVEHDGALQRDVCINLGGRSIYWSALIPRMNSEEIKRWPPDVADYLTGVGYAHAEVLFRKRTEFSDFEENLKTAMAAAFPDYYVDHTPRSFHSLQSRLPARLGHPDELPTGAFSTAALLLNSMSHPGLPGSQNLWINLNHLVTHIEVNGRVVDGVACQDLIENRSRVYRGKYVVLAAGVTESPCLALRSRLADPNGRIGVGLSDHQNAELQFDIPRDSPLFSDDDQAKMFLRPKLGSQRYQFTCELALNWKFWDKRYDDDDLWNRQFPEGQPIKSTIKFAFGNTLNDRNWIRLSPNDAGKPHVRVERMTDRPFEAEANKVTDQVLNYFGADATGSQLTYRQEAETYHLGGSLRMGARKSAVVDSHLKFHEYDNLYCCDLSVFPAIPMANPSLTLGALALRLSDELTRLNS